MVFRAREDGLSPVKFGGDFNRFLGFPEIALEREIFELWP